MTMSDTKEERRTAPEKEPPKEETSNNESKEEGNISSDLKTFESNVQENNCSDAKEADPDKQVSDNLSGTRGTPETDIEGKPEAATTQNNIAEEENTVEQIVTVATNATAHQDKKIEKEVEEPIQVAEMISKVETKDLSVDSSEHEQSPMKITSDELQGVLDNIKTNDSPIQAVNELTDVKGYTNDRQPMTSGYSTTTDMRSIYSTATQNNSNESNAIQNSPTGIYRLGPNNAPNKTWPSDRDELDKKFGEDGNDIISQESFESPSVLELTVGKLKVSQINSTLSTTSDGIYVGRSPANIPLPSSAPPDYLKELLFRSHLNRRKVNLNHPSFAPKRSPMPMFQSRRGRPIRRQNLPVVAPNFIAVSSAALLSPGGINDVGIDLSPSNTTTTTTTTTVQATPQHLNIDQLSNDQAYFINRQPLRKMTPKMNSTAHVQPLSLKIEPTTPSASETKATLQQLDSALQLTSPIARPLESPTLQIDESHSSSPVTLPLNLQDQPLDLCTKSESDKPMISPRQTFPSDEIYDENEPLNLSKHSTLTESNKYSPSTARNTLQSLPPVSGGLAGFWKTPPRSTFAGCKPSETTSPLEGDTASDTAANSPGLDNQTLPYGVFMSPNMGYARGQVVPMGQVSPTNQFLPDSFPEGAILLPGGSPHYRLSHSMALQHNEPPTPERPYMCEECGATFKRNKSLKQHHRVHSGERPFKCGDCDRHFRYSSTLKQHEKIHTGMKPHTCDVCPRRFAQAEKLKRTESERGPLASCK